MCNFLLTPYSVVSPSFTKSDNTYRGSFLLTLQQRTFSEESVTQMPPSESIRVFQLHMIPADVHYACWQERWSVAESHPLLAVTNFERC